MVRLDRVVGRRARRRGLHPVPQLGHRRLERRPRRRPFVRILVMARAITQRFDGVLIIGAGLAGLSAALACAPRKALVLSAAPLLAGCSSAWAQGGMAAAL